MYHQTWTEQTAGPGVATTLKALSTRPRSAANPIFIARHLSIPPLTYAAQKLSCVRVCATKYGSMAAPVQCQHKIRLPACMQPTMLLTKHCYRILGPQLLPAMLTLLHVVCRMHWGLRVFPHCPPAPFLALELPSALAWQLNLVYQAQEPTSSRTLSVSLKKLIVGVQLHYFTIWHWCVLANLPLLCIEA